MFVATMVVDVHDLGGCRGSISHNLMTSLSWAHCFDKARSLLLQFSKKQLFWHPFRSHAIYMAKPM